MLLFSLPLVRDSWFIYSEFSSFFFPPSLIKYLLKFCFRAWSQIGHQVLMAWCLADKRTHKPVYASSTRETKEVLGLKHTHKKYLTVNLEMLSAGRSFRKAWFKIKICRCLSMLVFSLNLLQFNVWLLVCVNLCLCLRLGRWLYNVTGHSRQMGSRKKGSWK